jgi:hypothetical protein
VFGDKPTGKNLNPLWLINIFAEIQDMLTEREKDFIRYWEAHRDRERQLSYRLLSGLPLGICFGFPILICFIFRSWYKWLPFISSGELTFITLGVVAVVLFFALFRQQYLWERKEQQYLEFKAKGKKDDEKGSDIGI